jgi:hypothetical protein
MNVDELWRGLGKSDELPTAAIESSIEHWDAVSPRYISKLRAFASGAKLSESDRDALFFVIHMCAEKKDSRAYAPLCEILARDYEVEEWLGDAHLRTLPQVLISLYDGDPEPLKRVVEAKSAHDWSRVGALQALAFVVRTKAAMTDDEMRAYLRDFGAKHVDDEALDVAEAWAVMIAALGFETLKADVARAMSKGYIEPDFYDIKEFHADLQLARSTPEGLAVFQETGLGPFESTIATLSEWEWGEETDFGADEFGDELLGDDDDNSPSTAVDPGVPVINPLRDIGRNDPCPCGSGKKFKKCCLAA